MLRNSDPYRISTAFSDSAPFSSNLRLLNFNYIYKANQCFLLERDGWEITRLRTQRFPKKLSRNSCKAPSRRGQTSLDSLNLLNRISSNHRVHFQWVLFHVGIDGNEKADF
ncbi:hypothetical protein TNCV_1000191 [Trichonephila clavipes]|nr:hypothetical protein TNCV_1000191 [Trichonephila clavipes]